MDQDRRNYFRVEDEVSLVYQVISQHAVKNQAEEFEAFYDFRFSLLSHLNDIDSKVEAKLEKIHRTNPDISEYLRSINKKFELIAKLMFFEDAPPEQHTQKVNLSAGGLAFKAREAIDVESLLEIKFVTYPSLLGIMVFGNVVSCRPNEDDEDKDQYPYIIAVEFEHIKESDREMLIRHILGKQVQSIRKKRQEKFEQEPEQDNPNQDIS